MNYINYLKYNTPLKQLLKGGEVQLTKYPNYCNNEHMLCTV